MKYDLYLGDSLEILKTLPSQSVDSLITDPPAGIGLHGLEWDTDRGGKLEWISWMTSIMSECHRVMKPGSHGLVWALPRTSHWTASALENAGFHVKDIITHVFGSGFPKNIAIDKAIDRVKYTDTDLLFKATSWIRNRRNELGLTNKDLDTIAGVRGGACHWTAQPPNGQPNIPTLERWERLESILGEPPEWLKALIKPSYKISENWQSKKVVNQHTVESTDKESKKWEGWGTALKPASEHWILIQKPISEHNIAANVLKHGTGGINVDASRISVRKKIPSTSNLNFKHGNSLWDTSERSRSSVYHQHPQGRFPSNFLITKSDSDNCPAVLLNDQSDQETSVAEYFKNFKPEVEFFYCKRPNKNERGLENLHPTVKPLRLMRYFCKMVTPPKGIILDPFLGSGTTGVAALFEKFQFIGIERDEEYHLIAEKRLKGVKNE